MHKLYISIFILLGSFLVTSCTKDYPDINFQLPEATQSGENIFGLRLNGKVWTNYGEKCNSLTCTENLIASFNKDERFNGVDFDNNTLALHASKFVRKDNKYKVDQRFTIVFHNLDSLGEYVIDKDSGFSYVEFQDFITGNNYALNPAKTPFKVFITKIDTISRIASGNFLGVLFNKNSIQDSIIIQDGRFDVTFELY